MKCILIVTIAVAFSACNQTRKDDVPEKEADSITISITDNSVIIGQWKMCSVSGNGSMTSYNVCPTVTFGSTGIGSIYSASGLSENFRWALKNNNLKISNLSKNSNNQFLDTTYTAFISQKENVLKLEIVEIDNNNIFYLSRYLNKSK